MFPCIHRKREEERRREAEQQLSLAGPQHHQISLVQVGSERLPSAATELIGEIKDTKPKSHKHRKSSKVHRSQSHDRTEIKPKEPGKLMGHVILQIYSASVYVTILKFKHCFLLERMAETPDTSQLSALNLPMTPQSLNRSETKTDLCVSSAPEECLSRPERHSPAGSSRPGSARHTHPVHSRPRTSGRAPGWASFIIPCHMLGFFRL